MLHHPCIRESPTKGTKSKRAQKRAEMLHHPCILMGPQQKRQNESNTKIGHKCYITPCIPRDAQHRGQNQSRPKRGRKCYITPAFSEVPNT